MNIETSIPCLERIKCPGNTVYTCPKYNIPLKPLEFGANPPTLIVRMDASLMRPVQQPPITFSDETDDEANQLLAVKGPQHNSPHVDEWRSRHARE